MIKLHKAQQYTVKHKLLIDNTQEIIIFFDCNGKVCYCNLCAINELGFDNVEDINKVFIYEIFQNAFTAENNHFSIETKYRNKSEETIAYRKNQTCFPVELKIVMVDEKKIFGGLCTAINISDKKEATRELKQLKNEIKSISQARNEFVANITHELRTPANGIMGLSNNLLETELTQSQIETVNLIKRCCYNMNTMINDLLDYAKISNDKMIIEQREFSFRNFIDQIIELNKTRINEKGLELLVDVSDEIPDRVIGDEFRLSQILNNLFSNAVKFTSIGQIALEVIKISQTDQNVELFFMLIDTGIGISLDEQDKLFQSFTQVDGSISRRFGGTGLGLSICKMLVEAMNGTIVVDSEKNKGSTFSFSVRLGKPNRKSGVDYSEDSESDNISNLLYEANDSILKVKNGTNSIEEPIIVMASALEKLTIYIEMESWDKAEDLAYYMKKVMPKDQTEITKNIFRLLLAIRKSNHDVSIAILNELKSMMNEVI